MSKFFKSKHPFRRDSSSGEASRKSGELLHFVKTVKKHGGVHKHSLSLLALYLSNQFSCMCVCVCVCVCVLCVCVFVCVCLFQTMELI